MNSFFKFTLLALTISSFGFSHPLEGNYFERVSGSVLEIDSSGYVITDFMVRPYFKRPYFNYFSAPVTVSTQLRKYHPTEPYSASGSISANACSFGANFEIKGDTATKTLTVGVTLASFYEVWSGGACMHSIYSAPVETHLFELR